MTASEKVSGAIAWAIGAVAAFEFVDPFARAPHEWWFAVGVTTAGAYLLWAGMSTLAGGRGSKPVALAALGAVLLAACVAFAAFLVGKPERVPAAPGQTYRLPHSADVALEFPDAPVARVDAVRWPDHVVIDSAAGSTTAYAGDVVRAGAFVFSVASGPIAYVDARSESGKPVTVTQPDGAAFLSPFLTFGGLDAGQPEDYFAVPALHRTVQVAYWPGLPARGIDVPFLALRIAEENGGPLYEGVSVSGRTLRKAGVALTFSLGSYPLVTASSAPARVPFWAGIAMLAAGTIALAARSARKSSLALRGR